jgi:hypothetical protein
LWRALNSVRSRAYSEDVPKWLDGMARVYLADPEVQRALSLDVQQQQQQLST